MKFEQDETVLYRLMLGKIRSIINVDGRSCYLLDSLESDHCQYQVPVENRMDHLQKLPDSASCQALLHRVQDLPMQKITRNAIARSCKSVLEQNDIVAWLSLLKTMHADKMSAEASGRKLPESEKHFYDLTLQRISIILAAGMHQSTADSTQRLLDVLDESVRPAC